LFTELPCTCWRIATGKLSLASATLKRQKDPAAGDDCSSLEAGSFAALRMTV
jgi:hypothetical protein